MTDLIGNTENAYEQESMLYILLNSSFFLADPSKLQKASVFLLNFIKNVLVAFMELDYLEQCTSGKYTTKTINHFTCNSASKWITLNDVVLGQKSIN